MTNKKRLEKLEQDTKSTKKKIYITDYIDRPTVKVGDVEMPRAEFDALMAGPEGKKYMVIQVEYVETPIPKNNSLA